MDAQVLTELLASSIRMEIIRLTQQTMFFFEKELLKHIKIFKYVSDDTLVV